MGIGRIGISAGSSYDLTFTTNASVLAKLLSSFTTNAQLVDILFDILTTNADILDGYQRTFTTNASIFARVDFELTTNAYIAALETLGFTTDANIIRTFLESLTTNASIRGPAPLKTFTTNASILGLLIKSLTTNAYIADLIALALPTNAYISEYDLAHDFTTNAFIATYSTGHIPTNADIVDYRYWAMGLEGAPIDLTGKVYDVAANGFGITTSKQKVRGSRRVNLQDQGTSGPEYKFEVYFKSTTEKADFTEVVNNDADNLVLFPGRSDRYFYIKKVSVDRGADEVYRLNISAKVQCLLEDAYQYHILDQGINFGANILPFTSTSVYNYGNAPSPILFRLGGQYYSGQLTLPIVKCMDSSIEESSLALGSGLLSAEYAELTLEGSQKFYLEHTYSDDFSTNNQFQYDAVNSGCTLVGGQISVPSGASFYYVFQGYPTKENIKLLATIAPTGSPIIQYSTDLITWNTALTASEMISGVQIEYWLTGTEKISTVYIRFLSPVGSSMTIQDVSFTLKRDISAQYLEIPKCPPGESRTLKVTGSGSGKAKVKTGFRARWQA